VAVERRVEMRRRRGMCIVADGWWVGYLVSDSLLSCEEECRRNFISYDSCRLVTLFAYSGVGR
jgi:hypothetical protein